MNTKTLLALHAALAFAAIGCNLGRTVKGTQLAADIQKELAGRGMNVTAVSCPASVPLQSTATFTCTYAAPDGSPLVITVKPDGQGNFDFQYDGLIDEKKVTDDLEPLFKTNDNLAVDIQCPPSLLVAHAGSKFTCPAQINGNPELMDCAVLTETGHVTCDIRYLFEEQAATDKDDAKFSQDLGFPVDIQCPKQFVVGHTGFKWSCPVSENGKMGTVDCVITEQVAGAYYCDLPGTIDEQRAADMVEPGMKASGTDVDIQCPPKVVVSQQGLTFTCPAVVNGKPGTASCTVTDTKGALHCVTH